MKAQLNYLLHSGQLFGTERMALATLEALSDQFQPLIIAPPGPLHAYAQQRGIATQVITGQRDLVRTLMRCFRQQRHAAYMTTSVVQAAWVHAMQVCTGGHGAHLHVVHGGTDERMSYGRKRLIQFDGVQFVAVSAFVKERLEAHGVAADRIHVIENFLTEGQSTTRPAFTQDGIRRVIMLSRLDRIKRVGLLFDALDRTPDLRHLAFDVYGTGEESEPLALRARQWPNVRLHGFQPDASQQLAHSDLLLHTCPEEPFGLVFLEAFQAGVPVLAPNAGGASCILGAAQTGVQFPANNPVLLGRSLHALRHMSSTCLNEMAQRGQRALQTQFEPRRLINQYRTLLETAA